jgi:7,8-dihydro-6-hydroxymethylpterin dimethyltransferase
MSFQIDLWTRFEGAGVPIYLRGDRPDWFVPNSRADDLLRKLARDPDCGLDIPARLFLERLPDSPPLPYAGRSAHLNTDYLRECWFHLTNRCNQSCRHCLFASSPAEKTELAGSRVLALADEAAALGCRVFALTGGEPLVHPEFSQIVNHLLTYDNTHVVVLTNGLLLQHYAQAMLQWPGERFHLQISLDGNPDHHDQMRGKGAFAALRSQLAWLGRQNWAFTLSMCVNADNVADMSSVVELAHQYGGANVHFLWYLVRGRGEANRFTPPAAIFPNLMQAGQRAAQLGVTIDNLESLRTQVFSPSGTIHDGPGSGWDSLAIGPDGRIYPSPALVGLPALATELPNSLATAWRESPVLAKIRQVSAASQDSPFRFILGGGDLDHSYIHGGRFLGSDPYLPLYEQLALWLIAQEVQPSPASDKPGLRLKMGEVLETCGANGGVALTHHNCLLAAAGSIDTIKAFYQDAALAEKTDILNPLAYSEDLMAHIPPDWRFRGYGCGSPVLEADLQPGDRVLDLGCGRGIECFIAAALVGPAGLVFGVDMLEAMLSQARSGAEGVAAHLGYDNLKFKNGYLEALPLESESIDVVLSNCVINLSAQKRRTFAEIHRVLRPGGRLIIADVVCDTEPPAALKNDDILRGECLAGAMTQKDLFGLLQESGFSAVQARKRFPYRQVQGQPFYSLTYSAVKPEAVRTVQVMYPGPLAGIVTEQGDLLPAGVSRRLNLVSLPKDTGELFILDDQGAVSNQAWEAPACCPGTQGCCSSASAAEMPSPARSCCSIDGVVVTPHPDPLLSRGEGIKKDEAAEDWYTSHLQEAPADVAVQAPTDIHGAKQASGCMVCGSPLNYASQASPAQCVYCRTEQTTNARCQQGHFVCDACHSREALAVIEHLLTTTRETDMLALLEEIRNHPAVPRHGPEHHSLVPGIILAAYRNSGGQVTPAMLQSALRRGKSMAGGACAYLGVCGAAAGVGAAFSLLLDANPVKPQERQAIKQITLAALQASAHLTGARCCQQECWLALRQAAQISGQYLPVALKAEAPLSCRQWQQNQECLGVECPLRQWKGKSGK